MRSSFGQKLKIIMPTTRLAFLVMTHSHNEDHRTDPRDVMAKAREHCWIPQRRSLAKRVIQGCPVYHRNNKRPQKQSMGKVPYFKATQLPPFFALGLDFMGPYVVKGMCGGRQQFKV